MSFRLIAVRSGWVKFCLKHRAWRDWNSVESGPDAGRAGTGLFDLSYRALSNFCDYILKSEYESYDKSLLKRVAPFTLQPRDIAPEPPLLLF